MKQYRLVDNIFGWVAFVIAKVIKRKDIIVGELRFLDYIIHFLFFTCLRS